MLVKENRGMHGLANGAEVVLQVLPAGPPGQVSDVYAIGNCRGHSARLALAGSSSSRLRLLVIHHFLQGLANLLEAFVLALHTPITQTSCTKISKRNTKYT